MKSIIGYIDGYDKVHFKVVKKDDSLNSHGIVWGAPKQRKWRWCPSKPDHINTYGEELDFEDEDRIWNIIDKYGS